MAPVWLTGKLLAISPKEVGGERPPPRVWDGLSARRGRAEAGVRLVGAQMLVAGQLRLGPVGAQQA